MQCEDLNLFFAEMADVRPLKTDDKLHFGVSATDDETARLRRANADTDERLESLSINPAELDPCRADDVLEFAREGVQDAVLKQLRLGRYEAKTREDFRGLKLADARARLLELIDAAMYRGERNLLLISGKGGGSGALVALIKSALNTWLKQLPEVQAFHSATREEGGSGAFYVMLRKSEAKKIHDRETHRKGARR